MIGNCKNALRRLAVEETAVASIEYALLGSLVAVVCLAVVIGVGDNVSGLFLRVCKDVSTAISGTPAC